MPDPDPLDELRSRVRETTEAAERIMREVPPRGWAAPSRESGEATSEMQALVTLLESLRDLLPPELRAQVTDLEESILYFANA